MLISAAGRFQMSQLVDVATTRVAAGQDVGGWGAAWCYGNRLETLKSPHPCATDPDFQKLLELRTDMVAICPDNPSRASPRELQPFTRRETGRTWAFYHHGRLSKASGLDVGGKIADSTNPSERYFLHLLTQLDPALPVESMTAALEAMAGEKTLSFCLVGSELLVAGCWYDTGSAGDRSEHALWLGQGELARYVTTQPLYSVPDTSWEQLPNRTVLVLQRERRELP